MTKKVYILTNGGHDYSDAQRYGELVFLDVPSYLKWDISQLYTTLRELLKDAEPEDYLLISHLTSHCCVATSILVEKWARVNFLLFRHDKYEAHTLITDQEEYNLIQN